MQLLKKHTILNLICYISMHYPELTWANSLKGETYMFSSFIELVGVC